MRKNTKKPVKEKTLTKRTTRVPRTHNGNTMTASMFFQWLRHTLRKASMHWKPIAIVRREAQVPYKGNNKRRKYSYVCSHCKGLFDGKEIHVHHKEECGELNCYEDIPGFVKRLFCEKEGLEAVCNTCHDKIHGK